MGFTKIDEYASAETGMENSLEESEHIWRTVLLKIVRGRDNPYLGP